MIKLVSLLLAMICVTITVTYFNVSNNRSPLNRSLIWNNVSVIRRIRNE